MNLRIALIVGTRPEVLKLYPLLVELRNRDVEHVLISTGQQRDLVKQTLKSLSIIPDVDLDLMKMNQTPQEFLSSALKNLNECFMTMKPSLVIVQGDTTSALAGAMAGYLNQVDVGHVEAGLRSHNLLSPWPEEGFRRAIDSISTFLWYPSAESVRAQELDQKSLVTGNTIVDTLRLLFDKPVSVQKDIRKVLVTLHRRESFNQTIESAMSFIKELSTDAKFNVVFVEHPNPNVTNAINATGLRNSKVKIIQPLGYLEFITLINQVDLIITDSGGLQEEARTLNKPIIVLRENSERMEALDGKLFRLSNPDGSDIQRDVLEIEKLLGESPLSMDKNPFGDGYSAQKIVQHLIDEKNS